MTATGSATAEDLSRAEVVVLGDSFVEGGLVAADDLMTATLGRLLGCQVANLGQSAYGPQQMLAVLKRYAMPLRPRLCIWTFYEGNDLDDVERYEQFLERQTRCSTAWDRSCGGTWSRALRAARPDARFALRRTRFRAVCSRMPSGRTTRILFRDAARPDLRREQAALDKTLGILSAARAECAADGDSPAGRLRPHEIPRLQAILHVSLRQSLRRLGP